MRPYEEYFNDEVIEILCQNSMYLLYVEPITDGNSLEPSFRLFCKNQTFFAKYSNYRRFSVSFLSELSQVNGINDHVILLPIVSKDIESLKKQLNIYEWLTGDNLKSVLKDAPLKTIEEYAYRCGALLRRVHIGMNYPSDYPNRIITSFDEYLKRIDAENYKFIKQFDYHEYFYNNCSMLSKIEKPCFVHMDYKPKNIMLCNDKIILTDLDSSCIGDPWWDFYDKSFSLYTEKELFNKMLIHAYFEDNIPDGFWEYFKVLSVYTLIQKTAILLRRKDPRSIRYLETYLWNSYDGFTELIPKWMY